MSDTAAAREGPDGTEPSPYQQIVDRLDSLPEEFNPAIRLDYELSLLEATGRLTLMMLIAKRGEIEFVTELGGREIARVGETVKTLERLPAVPKQGAPPAGF